jgi:ArsR family transcriptional regulator
MEPPAESFYEIKARVISVLANPKRLQIIEILGKAERTVSELASELDIAQATTSQHLAVMRKSGVVETRKEGNFVYYRIADPKIAEACAVMSRAIVDMLVSQQEKLRPFLAVAQKRGTGRWGR